MKPTPGVFAILILASVATQPTQGPRDPAPPPVAAHPPADASERGRLLATGRKLFVDRCAQCHGERGDKPLPSGLPLGRRKLTPQQLARSVNGRLRNSTEEQRQAVQLYIESFLGERTSN